MPKIVLPPLPDDIRQFGACVVYEEGIAELMEWARARERTIYCRYEEDGQERWLAFSLDACDDEKHVHFHVEIARSDLRENKEQKIEDLDEILRSVDEFLEQAADIEAIVQTRGGFLVPRRDIPEHGVIGSLLSFKKQSCGAPFSLRSAKLDIDHEWFTRMAFNYDEEREEVRVQLWSVASMNLDSEYLKELVEVMATGADCFIFERVSKEANA